MMTKTTPIITMNTKEYEILQSFAENLKMYCEKQDSCAKCILCTIMRNGFNAGMDFEQLLEDLFNKNILKIEY